MLRPVTGTSESRGALGALVRAMPGEVDEYVRGEVPSVAGSGFTALPFACASEIVLPKAADMVVQKMVLRQISRVSHDRG